MGGDAPQQRGLSVPWVVGCAGFGRAVVFPGSVDGDRLTRFLRRDAVAWRSGQPGNSTLLPFATVTFFRHQAPRSCSVPRAKGLQTHNHSKISTGEADGICSATPTPTPTPLAIQLYTAPHVASHTHAAHTQHRFHRDLKPQPRPATHVNPHQTEVGAEIIPITANTAGIIYRFAGLAIGRHAFPPHLEHAQWASWLNPFSAWFDVPTVVDAP
ncbi:hypothetical protein FN846DRAFT_886213 [Sphaerosporella brunnea]|uniref:Uncharacterized protein n=1 Tax=Sphaerosporella brunnea TaxID=1250544 RepID=A0A5J5F9A0_9PEZI|nr:hypothetical protein FN846DRAFT_886213 [Sphaerosporella brunnea]